VSLGGGDPYRLAGIDKPPQTSASYEELALRAGWREHHQWLASLGIDPPPRLLALMGRPVQT
jgi:hypothetical protein